MVWLGFWGILNNGKCDFGIIGEGIEFDVEVDMGIYFCFFEGCVF